MDPNMIMDITGEAGIRVYTLEDTADLDAGDRLDDGQVLGTVCQGDNEAGCDNSLGVSWTGVTMFLNHDAPPEVTQEEIDASRVVGPKAKMLKQDRSTAQGLTTALLLLCL